MITDKMLPQGSTHRYQSGFLAVSRWKIILLTLLLAVLGVVGYWYHRPAAAPDWASEYLPGLPPMTDTLYQWRDSQGKVWVTDHPPPGNLPYQIINYHKDSNVVPSER